MIKKYEQFISEDVHDSINIKADDAKARKRREEVRGKMSSIKDKKSEEYKSLKNELDKIHKGFTKSQDDFSNQSDKHKKVMDKYRD